MLNRIVHKRLHTDSEFFRAFVSDCEDQSEAGFWTSSFPPRATTSDAGADATSVCPGTGRGKTFDSDFVQTVSVEAEGRGSARRMLQPR